MNQEKQPRASILPRVHLGREIVTDRTEAFEREWLVTNGIGGFASASISGANTRRYHGLLVAALQPPLDRTLLLGKLDEELRVGGRTYTLFVNEWRDGTASYNGLNFLQSFELEGSLPTSTYQFGSAIFNKTVWMEYGFNTTYVRYTYLAPGNGPMELRVRPLTNYRDYHEATRGSFGKVYNIEEERHVLIPALWRVEAGPDALPWRLFTFDGLVQWLPEAGSGWYWHFHYRQEQARGLSGANEDMYGLGTYVVRLEPGQTVTFVASTAEPALVAQFYPGAYEREIARQQSLLKVAKIPVAATEAALDQLAQRLSLAADQFIVGRPDPARPGSLQPDYRTVLAGYHWFSDWGRDTMIALPGLTIATRRYEEAALILRSFARFVDKGMLPNRFPDSAAPLGEGDYNTVDATLWYFDAVDKYIAATGDFDLGCELYPVLADIVRWHVQGTRFGIKLAEDGLLFSGEAGVQLTWMDVKLGDWVVTPRRGKPIEITALWYRACRVMEKLAGRFGTLPEAQYYAELAARVAYSFERTYWYENGSYFYDNIDEFGQPDRALRPNQAIALAVAPELASVAKRRAALNQVQTHLLTPYGLRTLSPNHPDYHPTYRGDSVARDSAYHQGTIWPWPLGPFARALLSLDDPPTPQTRQQLRDLLTPFVRHLDEACVGQVNEIFGAEPPFPPVGCVAQAWSVSQLLEIWQLLN